MAKLKFDRLISISTSSSTTVVVPAGELWKVTIAPTASAGVIDKHEPAAPSYYAGGSKLKIGLIAGSSSSTSYITGVAFKVI